MEPNIQEQLKAQADKLEAIYISVEKTRKYFLVVLWVTLAVVVLPAIGMIFAIPTFLNTYSAMEGLV